MFVLDDYTKPIKYFIDDSMFFEIDSKISKKANFFVQNSQASLQDEIF